MTVAYDAGALIAADRNRRDVWAEHRVRLENGELPYTTAPVVAQVSRSAAQVSLRRFLRGCAVEPMGADEGHRVGALLGRTDTADIVDAHLVLVAARFTRSILTSDPDDIRRLAAEAGPQVAVRTV